LSGTGELYLASAKIGHFNIFHDLHRRNRYARQVTGRTTTARVDCAEVETGFVEVVTVGFQDPTVLKVRRVLLVKRLVPKGNL
jgi:hypothetical protein